MGSDPKLTRTGGFPVLFHCLRVSLLVAAVARSGAAQYVVRSWLPWRTVETHRFAFHYPVELEEWTRAVAARADAIDSAVARVVGFAPSRKTQVVVDDPFNIANGSAWTYLDKPTIKVSAAASLKNAFEAYAKDFDAANVSYSFAGSDELAAQIKAGARPDVYAAANTKLPDQLYSEGLVEKPVPFATNTLVIAVPADGNGKVKSLDDLAQPGVTIAAGSETVPVGSYTRKVLAKLPPAQEQAILDNIKSNEPDVAGVVGKVSQGAVDAGFVYITDVKGASGKLESVSIPSNLQPSVVYGAAVVKDHVTGALIGLPAESVAMALAV